MNYRKPEKNAKTYWMIKSAIGSVFLMSVIGAAVLFMNGSDTFSHGTVARRIADAVIFLLIGMQLVSIFILPAIEYRQWEYAISDDRVVIRHGIFFVTRSEIPIIRIQNVNMEQGPVQRLFDLYSVELVLASGSFDIEGLNRETADDICEKLNVRLHERIKKREGEPLS